MFKRFAFFGTTCRTHTFLCSNFLFFCITALKSHVFLPSEVKDDEGERFLLNPCSHEYEVAYIFKITDLALFKFLEHIL